ncbi:MAG TPA: class I SAM-dependent methyltransferase [Thermoplasmata archaeon]|nr:class I SAM-dependent methyltransferase [Thermoplasmata archaeon]
MERFERQLRQAEPGFRELIDRIPLQATPPLPPEWLRVEMLERSLLLRRVPDLEGRTVLEVGSGAHAISTVPLAWRVGGAGRVVALERSRWGQFRPVVTASGLLERIRPVAGDARRLPLRSDAADLAVCLHGLRSLRGDENTVRVVREMLRIAERVVLAESLPIARTDGQRAHLAMYNLRAEVFGASLGVRDDLPYLPLDRLASLVERAGGADVEARTEEIDLPHFLGYFPRTLVEAVPRGRRREELLERWDEAEAMRRRYGADHPPVGIVSARRSRSRFTPGDPERPPPGARGPAD